MRAAALRESPPLSIARVTYIQKRDRVEEAALKHLTAL